MAISCDPSDVANAARCFDCYIPLGLQPRVQAYLLALIANNKAGTSLDPQTLISQLGAWGVVSGMEQPIQAYLLCKAVDAGAFSGGGIAQVDPFRIFGVSGAATASWPAPPAGVTATQLWVSSDNVTYSLQTTVPAPGVGALFAPVDGRTIYAKARYTDGTNFGAYSTVQTDWTSRVLRNGGAQPGSKSRDSVIGYLQGLLADGIINEIAYLVGYPPDSIIAATTPLIVLAGNDPATNHGFVIGDLSVNGLVNNGGKYLDTGFTPAMHSAAFSNTNVGIHNYTPSVLDGNVDMGVQSGISDNACFIQVLPGDGNVYAGLPLGAGNAGVMINTFGAPKTGMYLICRTSNVSVVMYVYNSSPIRDCVAVSGAAANLTNPASVIPYFLFAENVNGVPSAQSFHPQSLHAFTSGLTDQATARLFAHRTQSYRVALGGGFI